MVKKLHYAWVVTLGSFLLYFSVGLVRFVYPYLVPTMEETLGISHTVMATILSFYFWADAIMRIIWGVLSDKIGARVTSVIGCAILASGVFIMSLGRSVFMLTLGFGIAGVGAAALFVLPTQILSNWFGRAKRGTAMGFAQLGTSIVTLSAGLIIPVILLKFPYYSVFRVESIALAAITILLFLIIRNKPIDMNTEPYAATPEELAAVQAQAAKKTNPWTKESLKQVVGQKSFYLILAAYFLFGFSNTGFITFRMGYLQEMGWEPVQLGRLISISSFAALLSPPLFGMLGDKIEKRKAYALGMVLLSIGMLVLLTSARSTVGLMIGLLFIAISSAGPVVLNSSTLPEYFPISLLGTSFGLIGGFFSIASAISPIVGGMIADATGNLSGVVIMSIAASLLGALCIQMLKKSKPEK